MGAPAASVGDPTELLDVDVHQVSWRRRVTTTGLTPQATKGRQAMHRSRRTPESTELIEATAGTRDSPSRRVLTAATRQAASLEVQGRAGVDGRAPPVGH